MSSTSSPLLKFAIMGSGGIGGYFGARLAQAGNDVTFIARGAHLAAIRQNGLRVLSPLGEAHIQGVRATDDPATIGVQDVVLFCVKLYDTEEAGAAIKPLVGKDTAVLSLQNGVDSVARLAPILGDAHLMGGAAYIAVAIESPGVIRHTGNSHRIVFGQMDGRRSQRAEALLAALGGAGIDAHLVTDIESQLWAKFVLLTAFSAATALARLPLGPLRDDADSRALIESAMGETAAVGRARGVALAPDLVAGHMARLDAVSPTMKPSLLFDLERGGRLEVASLSGAVARMGAELAVETPFHRTAYSILKHYEAGPPPVIA